MRGGRENQRRCCAKIPAACCRRLASERTIRDAWTILRSALSNAVTEELIPRNVASLAHVPKPRRRKVKPWTVEEARRFLESAKRDNDPLYAAYVLILVLGLRKGEVVGLPWGAVKPRPGRTRHRLAAPTGTARAVAPGNQDGSL